MVTPTMRDFVLAGGETGEDPFRREVTARRRFFLQEQRERPSPALSGASQAREALPDLDLPISAWASPRPSSSMRRMTDSRTGFFTLCSTFLLHYYFGVGKGASRGRTATPLRSERVDRECQVLLDDLGFAPDSLRFTILGPVRSLDRIPQSVQGRHRLGREPLAMAGQGHEGQDRRGGNGSWAFGSTWPACARVADASRNKPRRYWATPRVVR
jgi:hypothetical protein